MGLLCQSTSLPFELNFSINLRKSSIFYQSCSNQSEAPPTWQTPAGVASTLRHNNRPGIGTSGFAEQTAEKGKVRVFALPGCGVVWLLTLRRGVLYKEWGRVVLKKTQCCILSRASLVQKIPVKDSFRGFIEKLSLFSNRSVSTDNKILSKTNSKTIRPFKDYVFFQATNLRAWMTRKHGGRWNGTRVHTEIVLSLK